MKEWLIRMSKKKDTLADDYLTNKILFIFLFSFVLIMGLMFAYRGYSKIDTIPLTSNILFGFSVFGAAVALAGLSKAFVDNKNSKDTRYKVFKGSSFAVIGLVLAVTAFFAAMFNVDGIKLMYLFVPCAAALMLIYILYSFELCVIAVVSGVGAVFMWYLSRVTTPQFIWLRNDYLSTSSLALSITAVVLLGVLHFALRAVKNRGGVVAISGKEHVVFKKTAKYGLCHLTELLAVLCVIAAYICGAAVAYYLIFVLLAWLFIMAVYFTMKMM
jgi:hypothetical protein